MIDMGPGENPLECSSHSIRRSAAQWAARCGVDILKIRDIGRWTSFDHMALYVAEGNRESKRILKKYGGIDPIYKVWVFNEDTAVDSIAMTKYMVQFL
jgi:hypothetical protein